MPDSATEIYDFGLRLKKLRNKKGVTQKQLASRLGVQKETISRYENNVQEPSLKRAVEICVFLNTSLDYLMGLDSVPTIKLSNITLEQEQWLRDTIKLFFQE